MLQLHRLSEDEDEEDEGYATHVARKRAQQNSRSYVKRHQSWRSDRINHHHRADDKWESEPDADPDADHHRSYEHHRLNHHRHRAGNRAGYHSSPPPDDDKAGEGDEDYSSDDIAETHHRESKQHGFYDARGLGETMIAAAAAAVKKKHHQHLRRDGGGKFDAACGFPCEGGLDAKDERDKEWAALTTWIRMNLHQPRTAKRKVLFVGHHPTLNPVPGMSQSLSETEDGVAGAGAGAGVGAGVGAGGRHKSTKKRGGGKDGVDKFVFVLNPELDWSDVSHETRVRMKTLVAETQDIFARKYQKRKAWEWELKVQKYRAPGGGGKTFSVPLGNVVRGIQEAYFKYHQTSDGRNTPMTPSPLRELGSA